MVETNDRQSIDWQSQVQASFCFLPPQIEREPHIHFPNCTCSSGHRTQFQPMRCSSYWLLGTLSAFPGKGDIWAGALFPLPPPPLLYADKLPGASATILWPVITMKMKSHCAKDARDGGRKRLNNIRSLIVPWSSQTNISCNQFLDSFVLWDKWVLVCFSHRLLGTLIWSWRPS